MHVLIVQFSLQGLTAAEYYHGCDQEAPAFAAIPGLISKMWLADAAQNRFGGVYTFESGDALRAYLDSPLFAQLRGAAEFVDMTATSFDVLAGPTAVTGGVLQAVR